MDLSNSAKLINMLSVSRPIASTVEKFCVTDTKDTPAAVKRSIILAKASREPNAAVDRAGARPPISW